MFKRSQEYKKVYNFTNENVACLSAIYDLDSAKVLTVIGSGDQYFSSVLGGAKEIEVFDINPTAYLYFALKFFAIQNLTYKEFFDLFIHKKYKDIEIYNKLEPVLPKEVLKYYKFLITNKGYFKHDGVDVASKWNEPIYFNPERQRIPYLIKDNYYKLQGILKKIKLPNFYQKNIVDLKDEIKGNYDILLLSNIYDYLKKDIFEYTDFLNKLNINQIEACYDWIGTHLLEFSQNGYLVSRVIPSSPREFGDMYNYVYSLKK